MQSNQYQHTDAELFPRRILLAVTGLSPQVVTETLYALAVKAERSLIPTEVQVITTADGADRARLTLLSDEPGWFQRLRRDFRLPPIVFDETSIHVLPGANGRPLEDIRTPADNERAADFITERVRELTADPTSRLHASIAGGRKTMGFYVGYALSLYGRDQDCLSHVLVSARYESHPDFYYPTPYTRVIHTPPPDSRPLDTKEAEVT
ncbi:MAG: CRISPR-associated ring nuclease Csm6, partial [Gammaproteobacteria bacterium]